MKYLQSAAAALAVMASVMTSFANNTFFISPVAGKPWQSGNSSFDFTNWSFADNVLTNNANVTRIWTVQVPADPGSHTLSTYIKTACLIGGATTTAQPVSNFGSGGRSGSFSPVGTTSCGALQQRTLTSGITAGDGGIYVNFVVSSGGGQIGGITLGAGA